MKKRSLDCVALKNAIQARLLEESRRLGETEVTRRHRRWLASSNSSLATWWRTLPGKHAQEK